MEEAGVIMEGFLEKGPGVQREKMGRGVSAEFFQHWSGEHQAGACVMPKDRGYGAGSLLYSDLLDLKVSSGSLCQPLAEWGLCHSLHFVPQK